MAKKPGFLETTHLCENLFRRHTNLWNWQRDKFPVPTLNYRKHSELK